DVGGRQYTSFWLGNDNRVLAGMNVNIWEGLDDIKALIGAQQPVDPDRLADPQVSLGELSA
ncbi:MAG: oxidoreductase C-terminal domain-containing protein, partial [Mycobacterium sp.]